MLDNPISKTEWTLVQRYLIGPVTPAETDAAQAVVQREPRLQALVDVLQTTAPVTDSPTIDLGSLKRRIDATRMATPPSAAWLTGSKAQPLRRLVWPVAAALVMGVVVTAIGWNARARHGSGRTAASMVTYTTGNGERATITLPDGSTVALNVASRLAVPIDYMAGNRTVRLIGEGLFTVPRHNGAPFTVLVGTTAARVLGTSFVVRQYASDTATMVAVRDGKVAVGTTVVTANQLVAVGRDGVSHERLSDASPFTFAAGLLTLDGLLLPAAIVELDRWYDADVRLGDKALRTRRMKGVFAAGSLGGLAEILELTYNVRVVRNGRVLTLFPKQ